MLLSALILTLLAPPDQTLSEFTRSPYFGEQVLEERWPEGIRVLYNAPGNFDRKKPTLLIIYACPNGNTIEQTLGCKLGPGIDWHYDIQHIAAQTRLLRKLDSKENIVLACVEAEARSWPAWRQKHSLNADVIRCLIESAQQRFPVPSIAIAGHSGGGSFLFGLIMDCPGYIMESVGRIIFLDANYSFSDSEHSQKLQSWLKGSTARRLIVIAYDDRNITLDGKPVVSPTGGTFRATHRMLDSFGNPQAEKKTPPDFETYHAADGQGLFHIHLNPSNKILHTALVGEMNGFLHAMTVGTKIEGRWGAFGGPRAYTAWIQSEPSAQAVLSLLLRPMPSAAFITRIKDLPGPEREAAILSAVTHGNLPQFLRQFKKITAESGGHRIEYEVSPDYLAIGFDSDFVRIPMTPMTAQRIANQIDCSLASRKMADQIYAAAEVKLDPRPLTVDRELLLTFAEHNAIIEEQRKGNPLGKLVAGIKKDVVITNRLQEQPNRVALYGWHKLDGTPIQPLTIVHKNTYVDYSHGIRLVRRRVLVDGKPRDLWDILKDPVLCSLVSDEGIIEQPHY